MHLSELYVLLVLMHIKPSNCLQPYEVQTQNHFSIQSPVSNMYIVYNCQTQNTIYKQLNASWFTSTLFRSRWECCSVVRVQVHLTHTSLYNINIQVYIHKLTNSETKGTEHVILWPLLRDKRNRTSNTMAPTQRQKEQNM